MLRRLAFAAVLLALLVVSFVYGYLVHRDQLPPYGLAVEIYRSFRPPARAEAEGFWSPVATPDDDSPGARLERLRALGYVAGEVEGPAGAGVAFRSPRAHSGWTLYASAHAPEAYLLDETGRRVHGWRLPHAQAFPGKETRDQQAFWRNVELLPDGGLLVVFDYSGLARIDRDSNLLWALDNGAHHDATVGPEGNYWVLGHVSHFRDDFAPGQPITEDFIDVVTPEGERIRRISVLDAVLRSDFDKLALDLEEEALAGNGDMLHTNDIDLLPAGTELPRGVVRANPTALISWRYRHALALLDLTTESIEWVTIGILQRQHDPTLLPDGNLLAFDNRTLGIGSRAVEFDPLTQQIKWVYPEHDVPELFTSCCGLAQRLDNGNTLIVFTAPARALEVTPEGEIAWEFQSPHRTPDDRFVAQLMHLERLPAGPFDWQEGDVQ